MALLLLMAQECQILSKNNQNDKADKFEMVAHGTAPQNPWAYTTRCSTSFMTQWKIQNLSTLMQQHTMQ